MKVLVTGGNGFIGGHVVTWLKSLGHEPVVFDRRRVSALPSVLGDIRNANSVTDAMAHVDAFIHMAGLLGTQETIQNPCPATETNVMGGLNVLQAAAQYDVPGSFITVGNFFMDNTYAITKTAVERFCRMYNKERGTRINVVRVVNAYGPGQSVAAPFGSAKVRKVAPAFICRALSGMPIEVYGDGEQISDMVYVEDVALTLVRACEQAAAGNVIEMPIECGPAVHTTINAYADGVRQAAMDYAGVPYIPHVHLPMRPGEVPGAIVTADHRTLASIGLDVRGFTPITKGTWNTVGWYAEHEGVTWRKPAAV